LLCLQPAKLGSLALAAAAASAESESPAYQLFVHGSEQLNDVAAAGCMCQAFAGWLHACVRYVRAANVDNGWFNLMLGTDSNMHGMLCRGYGCDTPTTGVWQKAEV
jgi:hypothetical protein